MANFNLKQLKNDGAEYGDMELGVALSRFIPDQLVCSLTERWGAVGAEVKVEIERDGLGKADDGRWCAVDEDGTLVLGLAGVDGRMVVGLEWRGVRLWLRLRWKQQRHWRVGVGLGEERGQLGRLPERMGGRGG